MTNDKTERPETPDFEAQLREMLDIPQRELTPLEEEQAKTLAAVFKSARDGGYISYETMAENTINEMIAPPSDDPEINKLTQIAKSWFSSDNDQ